MSADGARKIWIECDCNDSRVVIDYLSITAVKYRVDAEQVPYCTVYVNGEMLCVFRGREADVFRGLFDAAKSAGKHDANTDADLLFEYTSLMNQHGCESAEAEAFLAKHQERTWFVELAVTARRLKKAMKGGAS